MNKKKYIGVAGYSVMGKELHSASEMPSDDELRKEIPKKDRIRSKRIQTTVPLFLAPVFKEAKPKGEPFVIEGETFYALNFRNALKKFIKKYGKEV